MLALDDLMARLAKLPGLGPRSARRLALHLFKRKDQVLSPLIVSMQNAYKEIKLCQRCFNLDDQDPCRLCQDPKRQSPMLCVVADVGDVWALERTAMFKGHYHVLGGLLSAVDGMGPDKLTIYPLLERLKGGGYQEVLFAFNATVDAQTTLHYIMGQAKDLPLQFTSLAKGVPLGGELDYVDDATLAVAFQGRLGL